MAATASLSARGLTACLVLALLSTACSRPPVRIDRVMQLSFSFPFLEPEAEGYTVLLSERDAITLGSATQSVAWPEESVARMHHLQTFEASNFIDEYEGDDFEPDVPCFQDAIIIREPSGDVREMFPPGECFGRGWFVGVSDVQPEDS